MTDRRISLGHDRVPGTVRIAFVATLPAQALTGQLEPLWLAIGPVVAGAAMLATGLAWQAGLRRYTSATS